MAQEIDFLLQVCLRLFGARHVIKRHLRLIAGDLTGAGAPKAEDAGLALRWLTRQLQWEHLLAELRRPLADDDEAGPTRK